MLKNLQLTCAITIFFAGSLSVSLYAQTDQDSIATTVTAAPKIKNGIIVKGIVKDAKTKGGLSGINVVVKDFSAKNYK